MSDTKDCLRCKKLGRAFVLPVSEFYLGDNGRPLPTCKRCRKELSKEHYRNSKRTHAATSTRPVTDPKIKIPEGARTAVTIEDPVGPKLAIWRCMSCYGKAVTRSVGVKGPPFPTDWRNMLLVIHGEERPTILCGKCSTQLLRAKRIMDRVLERSVAEQRAAREEDVFLS